MIIGDLVCIQPILSNPSLKGRVGKITGIIGNLDDPPPQSNMEGQNQKKIFHYFVELDISHKKVLVREDELCLLDVS